MESNPKQIKLNIPRLENQFFQIDETKHREYMLSDLAKSGLVPEDVDAYYSAGVKLDEGALAGYVLPYYDLNGMLLVNSHSQSVFYRIRMKRPDFSRERRYTQPAAEQSAKYGLPPFLPYIPPGSLTVECDTLVCCEGEKKAASVLKHLGMAAFGIGGANMWGDPAGSGGIHPWIRELADKRGIKKFLIIPDGDVYRYDICSAYGAYANALIQAGYGVEIVSLGNADTKIDDLILKWENEGDDPRARFSDLQRIDPESLVQSPDSLIKRFNLAFKQNDKGLRTLYQHSSNITRLMQDHPAFPKIWRNLDTNRVMVGDEQAEVDHTEMHIANYFQHYLKMDKVNKTEVMRVMQYLAKENAKSPFLDWVKTLEWDGRERLEDWMIHHWGMVDTPFVREVSKKWLVSACARMAKPGTKIDWMLIVIGKQGTGKTSMPGIVFKGNYTPIYGEHNDKDFHMLLHSRLCTGIDELDSFGKKETSTLKALITRDTDSFRPPYGASVEEFPRRFTLYGCGNRHEFLQHDPSGYRRYAIVEVNRLLDFSGLQADVDQLWAEAWELYQRGGERFWEVEGASEEAEKHVIANPLEETIESWLHTQFFGDKINTNPNLVDGKTWFTTNQLLNHLQLGKVGPNSSVMRDIGAILHSLGVEKVNDGKNYRHNGVQGRWMTWRPKE